MRFHIISRRLFLKIEQFVNLSFLFQKSKDTTSGFHFWPKAIFRYCFGHVIRHENKQILNYFKIYGLWGNYHLQCFFVYPSIGSIIEFARNTIK